MAESVGADERLVVMLEARVSEFEKRMAKAEGRGTRTYQNLRRGSKGATAQMEADMNRASGRINQALASISGQIGTFGKAFVGGLAAGAFTAALGAISSNIRGTVREIATMGDEAKRSGLGLKAFQEWSFVAQQNRVSLDALVDGFKELSLRADEWIVTGGGAAAEAFQRLGFSAADLKERLKDPSALMLEIIGRLKGLDQAARIRITDELFGGTGGEQFVQLIDQGEAGLRRTIDRAHELGRVMDEESIQKAAELDQKWNALADRVETFAKRAAIALADLPFAVVEDRINEIFDEAEGRHILGDEVYDQLRAVGALSDEQVVKLTALRGEWRGLTEEAYRAANALAQAAGEADMMGLDDLWQVLAQASTEMRKLADDFAAGTIDGETFRTKMDEIQRAASAAFDALDDADRVNFSGAISEVDRLGGVIAAVTTKVQQLYAWLKAAAGAGGEAAGVTTGTPMGVGDIQMPPTENAPRTSPKPKATPDGFGVDMDGNGIPDVVDDTRSRAAGGGKSKGGGGRSKDEFAKAVADTEKQIALLNAETAAFLAAADAGTDYGDMVEYARKKAELLMAAQEQGRAITPELTAQIEEQAKAYATAGQAAEDARKKIEDINRASERGRDALGGVFDAIIEGSGGARKAIADLLMEMAKVRFRSGMFGLLNSAGGGGIFGAIGKLLIPSHEGGGNTGNGPRSGGLDGKGGFLAMLHPRETVIDHTRGQTPAPPQDQAMNVSIGFDASVGGFTAFVRDQAGRVVAQATPGIVGQSVSATYRRAQEVPIG